MSTILTHMENTKETVVTAFKGFDEQFRCRGFQYTVGATYTHDGRIEVCDSGFHACENPLDVWTYYGPADSKFAIVEQTGEIDRHGDDDSKIASASITIKAELSLPEFVKTAVQWLLEYCSRGAKGGGERAQSADEREAKLAASGYYSKLAASGANSVIAATGPGSIAKGARGTWIAIAEFDTDGRCIGFATGCIGVDGLEPDVHYRAQGGKLVKVN